CKLLGFFSVTISRSSPQAAPDGVGLALTFFPRDNAEILAQRLLEIGRQPTVVRDSVTALQGRQQVRRRGYAAALLALFERTKSAAR
ncbi:hypothetical protein, partial [Mesorhizobium sp. M0494]|uniref:hypothetical protein n=1 Tax=unclassified Mesorhizobium TaxID=325217 RepID=UPI00333CAD54